MAKTYTRAVMAAGASLGLTAHVQACDLSLILALDVSASISAQEYRLQQEGIASALTDPAVTQAVTALGGLWINAFEWSGSRHQYEQLGWSFVEDADGLASVAAIIRDAPRRAKDFPTSLGFALGHALNQMARAPERCRRRVIDVSSDGDTNDGFPPESAYRAHDMADVTVNALVITKENQALVDYYYEEVIWGSKAFVEVANQYTDYEDAMRRKLLREIGAFSYVQLGTNK